MVPFRSRQVVFGVTVLVAVVAAGRVGRTDDDKCRIRRPVCFRTWAYESVPRVVQDRINASGQHELVTYRQRVYSSVTDPFRNVADPGSFYRFERIGPDGHGGYSRQEGYAWQSNGVQHEDSYRTHVWSPWPDEVRRDVTHILKAPSDSRDDQPSQ
jgi:hypothetical protein